MLSQETTATPDKATWFMGIVKAYFGLNVFASKNDFEKLAWRKFIAAYSESHLERIIDLLRGKTENMRRQNTKKRWPPDLTDFYSAARELFNTNKKDGDNLPHEACAFCNDSGYITHDCYRAFGEKSYALVKTLDKQRKYSGVVPCYCSEGQQLFENDSRWDSALRDEIIRITKEKKAANA